MGTIQRNEPPLSKHLWQLSEALFLGGRGRKQSRSHHGHQLLLPHTRCSPEVFDRDICDAVIGVMVCGGDKNDWNFSLVYLDGLKIKRVTLAQSWASYNPSNHLLSSTYARLDQRVTRPSILAFFYHFPASFGGPWDGSKPDRVCNPSCPYPVCRLPFYSWRAIRPTQQVCFVWQGQGLGLSFYQLLVFKRPELWLEVLFFYLIYSTDLEEDGQARPASVFRDKQCEAKQGGKKMFFVSRASPRRRLALT